MASIAKDVHYAPVPTNHADNNVVVLTVCHHPPHRLIRRRLFLCLSSTAILLVLAAAIFLLYPSNPEIQIARIKLNHIQLRSLQKLVLDLSFSLTIRVRNKDFFSLDYHSIVISVGYRGRELGFVSSDGGRVKARVSSYVNASLDLNGLEIIHDIFYLLEDLSKGVIPFDTDTKVQGNLGLLFFKIPLKASVTCEVFVNVSNQTVLRQNCSPERSEKKDEFANALMILKKSK